MVTRTTPQDAEFEEIPGAPATLEDFDDAPEPEDISFTNLLSDLGVEDSTGRVNVYKLEKGEFKSQIFLFDCTPQEFSMSMLQNPDYHTDGFHKFRVVARNRSGIAKAKTLSAMPLDKPVSALNAPPVDLTPITAAIAAMNENTNKVLMTLAQTMQPQPQQSRADFLQEMLVMKQMFGGGQKESNPMDMMKMAVELAQQINPREGEAGGLDVLMKALDTFGKPLAEAVSGMPAVMPAQQYPAMVQPAPVRQINPVPAPAPVSVATEPTPTPQPEPEPDDMFMLKQSLGFLAKQAETGGDTSLYAELVLDQTGDDIKQYLDVPNWWELLVSMQPKVEPHKEWFTELRTNIKNMLTEEGQTFTTDENLISETSIDVHANGPTDPDDKQPASNP